MGEGGLLSISFIFPVFIYKSSTNKGEIEIFVMVKFCGESKI